MHDETNELNDIILNRSERRDSRKKVMIGIGTLAVVLIIVVIVMGRISGSKPAQLPQPKLPGEHRSQTETVKKTDAADRHLSAVAEKVRSAAAVSAPAKPAAAAKPKEEDIVIIDETSETRRVVSVPAEPEAKKPVPPAPETVPVKKAAAPKTEPVPAPPAKTAAGGVYIQVGSFSRYKPNKSFLAKIERSGYRYRFHRVVINGQIKNKVLVGPFADRGEARHKLNDVRRRIEPGAFIYTIKP